MTSDRVAKAKGGSEGMARQSLPDLSEAGILRMAQSYLSRRAASMAQLRRVLMRKVARETAAMGDERPDAAVLSGLVETVLERIGRSGLIDEPALAQSRAATLMHKGLSSRSVRRKLVHQGLDPNAGDVGQVLDVADEDQARRFAERKRLGSLATGRRAASPDRDIRAMVRAGFSPDLARRVLRSLAEDAVGETPEAEPDLNAS